MKNTLISLGLLASSIAFSTAANANADDANHWSIGVGSYAFTLTSDKDYLEDDNFSGFNLTAGYAFNNHLQARVTYFTLEHDTYSSIDSKGYDIMIYGGTGFAQSGFRGYGGAGYFSDKWKVSSFSESFSGLQFGGGLGYNWGPAALDFVLTFRQADAYEDLVSASATYVAMSGNLSMSYLF